MAAVIDLKRPYENYPYRDLSGCGLIFRLMLDLYRSLGEDYTPLLDLLDLVAIAAIADRVPLIGENRALVQYGMKLILSQKRPFFKALAQEFNHSIVTAHDTIGYIYAPLIHSISRMGEDTSQAVEAMLTQNLDTAVQLVHHFRELNDQRKKETSRQLNLAKWKLRNCDRYPAIVIRDREIAIEMADILAAKLRDIYHCPVIVFASLQDEEEQLKGFGRSIDGFSLADALVELSS